MIVSTLVNPLDSAVIAGKSRYKIICKSRIHAINPDFYDMLSRVRWTLFSRTVILLYIHEMGKTYMENRETMYCVLSSTYTGNMTRNSTWKTEVSIRYYEGLFIYSTFRGDLVL